MSSSAVERLTPLVTEPYRRGAETLEIVVLAEVGATSELESYDFAEYRARHGGEPPAARYIVRAAERIGPDPVRLAVEFTTGGAPQSVSVSFAAGSPAGTSVAVPLPAEAGPDLRLLRLRRLDPGPSGWRVLALLGNLSKLLWVLGAEQDLVRAGLEETADQRALERARSASLDLLGSDLRVPRFPARPYSFDADTIALYHMEEHPLEDLAPFADETTNFGLTGHPGIGHGVASGAVGKFGHGFELPGAQPDGHLRIPHHPDFNVAAAGSFTVELFLRLEPAAAEEVRAVVVKGSLNAAGDPAGNGWSLTTGAFRGIPDNLRWAGRTAAGEFAIFADEVLADGAFHHVAATVDRDNRRARLFIDGVERASTVISGLGAFSNSQMVRIGRSALGHQLSAVVDELRFARVARREFDPVLGEGDSAYRRRLAIFERWRLPSAATLLAAINEAASTEEMPDPFVILESDRPTAYSARPLRLLPEAVPVGTRLDRDGNTRSAVEDVCGRAEDEPGVQEAFLLRHESSQIGYAGEAARKMQVGAALRLEALTELIAQTAVAGELFIERSYDPTAELEPGTDLHRVGRALVMRHPGLDNERLAALAHEGGFDFVTARATSVFATAAPGPLLEVTVTSEAPEPAGADLFEGGTIDLTTRPGGLPGAGRFSWSIVNCGVGRGELQPHPEDPPDSRQRLETRPRLRLAGQTAGELVVAVEYRHQGVTVTGSRTFRIGPATLAQGEGIAANGDRDSDVDSAAGEPEADFDARYLVQHASGLSFAGGVDPSMQISLDRRLSAFVERLSPFGDSSQLEVVAGFDPADSGLRSVARAVICRHASLDGERLARLAHLAGFSWVERLGTSQVLCAEAAGERIEIVNAADGSPVPSALTVGSPFTLGLRPASLADGSFNWSLDQTGFARASLLPLLRRETTLSSDRPGLILLSALFLALEPGSTAPYSFEVRLRPELDQPDTILPKEKYDLVMNILNHFHPIGVEVVTRNLREHVVEIGDDLLNAFPGYTYPEFRA